MSRKWYNVYRYNSEIVVIFFFKQKTEYEMRISDWRSDVCSSDLALEVILGQGSVRLVNGADAAGQLNMISDDIIVATAEAIADVGAATSTAAINTRLEQNDGILLDEGALFARGIRAEVVGGFYVQNSGAGTETAQRRDRKSTRLNSST